MVKSAVLSAMPRRTNSLIGSLTFIDVDADVDVDVDGVFTLQTVYCNRSRGNSCCSNGACTGDVIAKHTSQSKIEPFTANDRRTNADTDTDTHALERLYILVDACIPRIGGLGRLRRIHHHRSVH